LQDFNQENASFSPTTKLQVQVFLFFP